MSRSARIRVSAILAIAAVGISASVAFAGGSLGERIDRQTARGDFAVAQASGSADDVRAIYVKVQARPKQNVSGAWTVVCSRGAGSGSKSGHVRGTTTLVKRLRIPYSHADTCVASANAQLADSGKVTVKLFAKHAGRSKIGDRDCGDFRSRRQAQRFFRRHHPHADPFGLDADHDGRACETYDYG